MGTCHINGPLTQKPVGHPLGHPETITAGLSHCQSPNQFQDMLIILPRCGSGILRLFKIIQRDQNLMSTNRPLKIHFFLSEV